MGNLVHTRHGDLPPLSYPTRALATETGIIPKHSSTFYAKIKRLWIEANKEKSTSSSSSTNTLSVEESAEQFRHLRDLYIRLGYGDGVMR